MVAGGRGRGRALAALIVVNVFWAGNYIVGAIAVDALDPISLTFLRWLPASLILLALAHVIERPDWRRVVPLLPRLAVMSILGMIGFSVLLYEGLRHTTPVTASLVSSASPVLITVVAAVALRERAGWRAYAGLALGLVGVAFVVSRGDLDSLLALDFNPGDLWVIAATLCWVAYTVIGRVPLGIPNIASNAVQALVATVLLGAVVAVTGLELPEDVPTWGSLGFIVLFAATASYILWNSAIRTIPAAIAGLTLNLIPVFVAVIEFALGETITLAEAVGGAIVLSGVLLATVPVRRAPRAASDVRASPTDSA